MEIKQRLEHIAQTHYHQGLSQCDRKQVYHCLLQLTQELCATRPAATGTRKLYYFSAEFLLGKLLSNNLLALGIYQETSRILTEAGHTLALVEETEPEPSLGNGGLGRLAACFLDSAAALGLPVDGVGLLYHYGLFQQKFQQNKQTEYPNPWIQDESWLLPTGTVFSVPFASGQVKAILWDVAVPGAHSNVTNRLHLFDVETPAPPPSQGIHFDKTDLPAHLTAFLYPDDSDEAGRLLRVYQQYFMVSAGAQLVLKELEESGASPDHFSNHVAIQINDTHPSMVIPELIRLLTARGLSMEQAIHQVSRACAYTNHTILAEALEKWPLDFIQRVAPVLVPIIRELDRRVKETHSDPKVAILMPAGAQNSQELVHMAHMDIHYSASVNGVAALHTEILKSSELKPFYLIYPDKFNNKTNGITLRRWLEVCNPRLAALLDDCLGQGWRQDPMELQALLRFEQDSALLDRLLAVKRDNKAALSLTLTQEQGVALDAESVFDIQAKRLHEYKRQQMNALYVIHKYLDIKEGRLPPQPITVIFGGKAAPAYRMAKHIIHLVLSLQQLIDRDPQVRPWLQVVMLENYNVTWAERLIPACDISEQISLASKEASGTGNMKFMANGAVTLGTLDGANVEIAQLVGSDNIYTFGAASSQVIELYGPPMHYHPDPYYQRPNVKPLVDFLLSPALSSAGDPNALRELWNEMTGKDWFMALLDVEAYIAARDRAIDDYGHRTAWAKKMLVNIAHSGYFSSDRTVAEYNQDIWRLT